MESAQQRGKVNHSIFSSLHQLSYRPVYLQGFLSSCIAEVKSVKRHLHALMCSVSDHPSSCE